METSALKLHFHELFRNIFRRFSVSLQPEINVIENGSLQTKLDYS